MKDVKPGIRFKIIEVVGLQNLYVHTGAIMEILELPPKTQGWFWCSNVNFPRGNPRLVGTNLLYCKLNDDHTVLNSVISLRVMWISKLKPNGRTDYMAAKNWNEI